MRRRGFQIGVWGIGLLLAGWLSGQVDPGRYEGGRARDEQARERRNRSALATLMGGFRTSASDLMFIKTERYLHGGVAYRHEPGEAEHAEHEWQAEGEAETEEHAPAGHVHDHDHGHEHEHGDDPEHGHEFACGSQGLETAIPRAAADFRGWIGDLYREVKPWRDPSEAHVHTDGRELLPWFRLMTVSDPTYVQGYLAGGFWLQQEGTTAAWEFIEEGLRNNPGAFPLYVSRGLLRVKQAREAGGGESGPGRDLLELAREDFEKAAELGRARRGRGEGLARYEENDLFAACRMTILVSERLGDADRARRDRARFADMGELFPSEGAE